MQDIAAQYFIQHGVDVLIAKSVERPDLIILSSLLSFIIIEALFPLRDIKPKALVQIIPHFGNVIFLKFILISLVHSGKGEK